MAKKKSTKEKKGEPFEKLMTAIQMAFHPDDKVEHNIKVRQSSGVNRQVDVSVAGRKIIVECKDKSRKVTLTEMDAFINLCRTTGSEGIFVSRKGFAPNVIKNAEEANIKTFTLAEIAGELFKNSFYIPPITMIVMHHRYIGFGWTVDQGHQAGITLDNFVYDHEGKAIPVIDFVNPGYKTYMDWNLYDVFYKPVAEKLKDAAKSQEELDDLLRRSAVVKQQFWPVAKNRYFVKQNGELVPLGGILYDIEVKFTVSSPQTTTYQQKDVNNKVVSTTVTTDIKQDSGLYSLTVVNTGDPNEPAVTLVPRWRSSEILKVPKLN
jgi:hypothetical protein